MSMHTSKRSPRFAMTPAPSIVRSVVSSPGRSLESTTRAFMEPRFSRNSGVPLQSESSQSMPSRLGISNVSETAHKQMPSRGASLIAPCLSEISEVEEVETE